MNVYDKYIGDCLVDKKLNKLARKMFTIGIKGDCKFDDICLITAKGYFVTIDESGTENGNEYFTIRVEKRFKKMKNFNIDKYEKAVI